MRPVQALSDGEGHGRQGERFLQHRPGHGGGDRKHLGLPGPCETAGEPARSISHSHLTGEPVCSRLHSELSDAR